MNKVLVVEDNADNLRLISKVLERGGYKVEAAATGTAGIEMAAGGTFAFIVMDINLPDMSGLEAARQIRALESGNEVPIIAVTSYAMRGDMARILAAGCNGYFEKPINPLNILDEIHKLIGRKK
ncbi:MAG: response regulator [Elusimicrobiales bacterium]